MQLFDHPLASIDEMKNPTGKPLARFSFHSKAAADGHAAPSDLAKQCKPLG
ncbi:MAG: hypothetical protein WDM85_19505 [Caulobacteraceae bacterium]